MTQGPYRIGERIDGRWEILSELGTGGVGVVYAVQHAFTHKPGALKVLKGQGPNAEVLASKMHHEAMLLSRTPHPHLVEVYDAGRDERGIWMVMERLVGRELRQVIDAEGALPVGRALRYAEHVAAAVAAVHDVGVIHRDLKPANIHVSDKDVVKVIDFGTARFRQGATMEGQVVGTVPYMAPEHLRDQPLDGRADVFALGIVLYEMLTGRHPFRNARTHDGWPPSRELIAMMFHEPLPSIEARVGSDVWHLVARAAAKNRDKRFVSMATFAAEIQRVAGIVSGGQLYAPTQRLPEGGVPQIAPTVPLSHLEQARLAQRDAERQRASHTPPLRSEPGAPRPQGIGQRFGVPTGVVVGMFAAIVILTAVALVLLMR